MKVCLIHYDVNRIVNEPGNRIVMKHFGHMPNIQLLYVAAIMEKLGIELLYLDIVGMEIETVVLEKKLLAFQPDLIGLSVYTSHFHNATQYAAYLKNLLPGTKIMMGGVHTLIFPVETLQYNAHVDYLCVGEAEMVLPEFFHCLQEQRSFGHLKGLVWREGGVIRYNGPAEENHNLDEVPFPARHLVPNEKYFNFISERRNYTVFNTSRGCPFQCIFCEAAGKKWRARSARNVVDEFEVCYGQFGIREVDIFDSSFTVNKKRVLDICQGLIERGLHKKVIWNVRSRVDTIDGEMLEALKAAGCYRIFYGIESGNPDILRLLRKMEALERMEEIIKLTRKKGISTFGYFLIGSPEETEETVAQTVAFAKKLPLDFAIFNGLTPFPKTALYEDFYLPRVERDFWQDYIKEPQPIEDFIGRPWTQLPDQQIRKLSHKAMLQFYFRPLQLWRCIRTVRSWEQFWRYIRAGVDMTLSFFKK